jgi:hypothetical protein
MKAEQEGAFFSSESGEKNRTGWVGQACLKTSAAEMPIKN